MINTERSHQVQSNSRISIHYKIILQDGSIFDQTGDEPLALTLGDNTLPGSIEALLQGMKPGESKSATLTPEQAWGYVDTDNIQTLAIEDFPDPGVLEVGNVIEFNLAGNDLIPGTIKKVSDNSVEVDFNPPLAGLTISIDITLVKIT